jgi:CBS domain containing-hemolysin-like protein
MSATPFWVWAVLAALLALSGSFSSLETALFSLRPVERRRAGARVERLLENPRSLLATILLGNLAINLLFFAFAARVATAPGRAAEVLAALGALLTLVVFGEVLPKALALRARTGLARLGALPLSILVALLGPPRRAVEHVLELCYRLLGEAARHEQGITPESLARALERSTEHGVLLESEAEILSGVVELGEVRVREIMTPRVDLLLLDVNEPDRERIVREAVERKLPWLVVVDESPDRVLGRVRVRDLLIHPGRSILEMLVAVRFVPEVASALHLLHFLREQKVAQALVVDEWGGTAGVVTIEDIFEEVVGELRVEGEPYERPVVPLGEGAFRVVGSLSIRDWNEQFGHRVVPTEFETLGGFVTALLGRIPRTGDEVRSGPLVFRVHDVRRRRIQTVDVSVAEPAGVPA